MKFVKKIFLLFIIFNLSINICAVDRGDSQFFDNLMLKVKSGSMNIDECIDSVSEYSNSVQNHISVVFNNIVSGSVHTYTFFDYCSVSLDSVYKFSCYSNYRPVKNKVDCVGFCENGVCQKTSIIAKTIDCYDSDGGIYKFLFGETSNHVSLKKDMCIDSYSLREFYCGLNNEILYKKLICSNGCKSGVCLSFSNSTISSGPNSSNSTISSGLNSSNSTISSGLNSSNSTIPSGLNSSNSTIPSGLSSSNSTIPSGLSSSNSTISSGLNSSNSTISSGLSSIDKGNLQVISNKVFNNFFLDSDIIFLVEKMYDIRFVSLPIYEKKNVISHMRIRMVEELRIIVVDQNIHDLYSLNFNIRQRIKDNVMNRVLKYKIVNIKEDYFVDKKGFVSYNDDNMQRHIKYNPQKDIMRFIDINGGEINISTDILTKKYIERVENGIVVKEDIEFKDIVFFADKLYNFRNKRDIEFRLQNIEKVMNKVDIKKYVYYNKTINKTKVSLNLQNIIVEKGLSYEELKNITVYLTVPKEVVSSSYDINILNDAGGVRFVVDKDPIIGWYFEDGLLNETIEYEIDGSEEGGTIVIVQEAEVFNGIYVIVNYREGDCALDEILLFELDDIENSKVFSPGSDRIYKVCIAHVEYGFDVSDFLEDIVLFGFDKDGRVFMDFDNVDNKVSISIPSNYKWDIQMSDKQPSRNYSCVGSVSSNSNSLFGDCVFGENKIWISFYEEVLNVEDDDVVVRELGKEEVIVKGKINSNLKEALDDNESFIDSFSNSIYFSIFMIVPFFVLICFIFYVFYKFRKYS